MSQIEAPKVTAHVALGPASDEIAVSKLTVHVILVPSEAGEDTTGRQGHVHTRIVRDVG